MAAPAAAPARRREQRSLFGEILDWMLAPLLLLWPMSLGLTWVVAQAIAARPYDRELAAPAADLGLLDDDDLPLPLPRQLDPALQRTARLASLDPDDGIDL